MVLCINEHSYNNHCSLEDLAQHTDLTHLSSEFASSVEYKQTAEEISKTVYVHQHEFAVLAKDDPNGFHLIGSDNATTCHILVLVNEVAVTLAHLDGTQLGPSIEQMSRELMEHAPTTIDHDVYLVGE